MEQSFRRTFYKTFQKKNTVFSKLCFAGNGKMVRILETVVSCELLCTMFIIIFTVIVNYFMIFSKLTQAFPGYAWDRACARPHMREGNRNVRIKGLKMLVFRKMLRTYLMDNPYWKGTLTEHVKNTFKARNFHGMQILWLRFEIREIKIPPKILF